MESSEDQEIIDDEEKTQAKGISAKANYRLLQRAMFSVITATFITAVKGTLIYIYSITIAREHVRSFDLSTMYITGSCATAFLIGFLLVYLNTANGTKYYGQLVAGVLCYTISMMLISIGNVFYCSNRHSIPCVFLYPVSASRMVDAILNIVLTVYDFLFSMGFAFSKTYYKEQVLRIFVYGGGGVVICCLTLGFYSCMRIGSAWSCIVPDYHLGEIDHVQPNWTSLSGIVALVILCMCLGCLLFIAYLGSEELKVKNVKNHTISVRERIGILTATWGSVGACVYAWLDAVAPWELCIILLIITLVSAVQTTFNITWSRIVPPFLKKPFGIKDKKSGGAWSPAAPDMETADQVASSQGRLRMYRTPFNTTIGSSAGNNYTGYRKAL